MRQPPQTEPESGSTKSNTANPHEVSEISTWQSFRDYPAFRILFGSTLATNSGFWMWNIAIGWLALILTDSPFFVGLVGFTAGIPTLIFGPFGGVLIDKFARKTILIVAQTVIAVTAVSVSALLLLDLLQPWMLLLGAFTNGLSMSLVFPTRSAMVANLIPKQHLPNAIALNSAGLNATRVIGPALAGPSIAILGIEGTFALCAGLQISSFVFSLRLPWHPASDSGRGAGIFTSIARGFQTVWQSEKLLGLFALAAIPTLCLMPYVHLMPVFARDELAIGSTGLGILMAVNGVGAVLGSLFVAATRSLPTKPVVLLVCSSAFASVLILFSLTPYAVLAGVFLLAAGFSSAVFLAVNNTLVQLQVDDQVRGRVLGIYGLTWGLMPVGTLPAGAIADAFGAPAAMITLAMTALVLIILVGLRFPSLRKAETPASGSEPQQVQPVSRTAG
jgi:MFS family permease